MAPPKYCDTPEKVEASKAKQRAADKARNQTPERKAYQKARYQTLCKEQSTADAFRMMQAASELSKALANLPNTKTQ